MKNIDVTTLDCLLKKRSRIHENQFFFDDFKQIDYEAIKFSKYKKYWWVAF
jgi:hypothetical protein